MRGCGSGTGSSALIRPGRAVTTIEGLAKGGEKFDVRITGRDADETNGFGDYIILKVGADGQVEKWRTPAVEMVCECDEDAQHGWKKLPNA